VLQDGKTCSCGQTLKEQCLPGKGTPSCAKTSVNCIEGTGDFRIAIWDTHLGTAPRPKNNFCTDGNGLHTCMDAIGERGGHTFAKPLARIWAAVCDPNGISTVRRPTLASGGCSLCLPPMSPTRVHRLHAAQHRQSFRVTALNLVPRGVDLPCYHDRC